MAQYIECTTADNRLVGLWCEPADVSNIMAALAKAKEVGSRNTKAVNVEHGGYGCYSRFDIFQHKYAGGGHPGFGSYIEILEIKNPPDNRCGYVIHEDISTAFNVGSTFHEFRDVASMMAIWERVWGGSKKETTIQAARGYIRTVKCGGLSPWFYAVGNQALYHDFAFPNNVGNDPVFRPLKKFIVPSRDDICTIKVCLGCCEVTREVCGRTTTQKIIYWDDGSMWDEYTHGSVSKIQPLTEANQFVQQAVDQFRHGLSGEQKIFTILFSNDTKFVGKFCGPTAKGQTRSGQYFADVVMTNGTKDKGTFEFTPTPEAPTVESFLQAKGVTKVNELRFQAKHGSKKWAGVFQSPLT